VSNVRNWAVVSAVSALILLSPIMAFLIVISAEMLIDVVMEARVTAICAVAAGAMGWLLLRKHWPSPEVARESAHAPARRAGATPPG
jgi:hypothetical protein